MEGVNSHFTSEKVQSRHQIHNLLRDITLAIGGVFYTYPVPDDAVWEVARSLDRIFSHALNSKSSSDTGNSIPPKHSRGRKHPAVAELLRRLDGFGAFNSVGAKEEAIT